MWAANGLVCAAALAVILTPNQSPRHSSVPAWKKYILLPIEYFQGTEVDEFDYEQFYAQALFERLKERIGYQGEWSAAYGFHPAVLEYKLPEPAFRLPCTRRPYSCRPRPYRHLPAPDQPHLHSSVLSSESYLKLQFVSRRRQQRKYFYIFVYDPHVVMHFHIQAVIGQQRKYIDYFYDQKEAPHPVVVNLETVNRCNSTCEFGQDKARWPSPCPHSAKARWWT